MKKLLMIFCILFFVLKSFTQGSYPVIRSEKVELLEYVIKIHELAIDDMKEFAMLNYDSIREVHCYLSSVDAVPITIIIIQGYSKNNPDKKMKNILIVKSGFREIYFGGVLLPPSTSGLFLIEKDANEISRVPQLTFDVKEYDIHKKKISPGMLPVYLDW